MQSLGGFRRHALWLGSVRLLVATSCGSGKYFNPYGSRSSRGDGGEGNLAGDGAGAADDADVDSSVAGQPAVTEGQGGAGGAESGGPLTIVSVSPSDGATDVERDVVVKVEFSAALSADTVTASSFTVVGPAGAVAGEFEIDGRTVTFTADTPWSLLADYTIRIAGSIAADDGSGLGDSQDYVFHTRDGAFSKPKRLGDVNAYFMTSANRAGHVAVTWADRETVQSVEAAVFDPSTHRWSATTTLETDMLNSYDSAWIAVNERGDAFAVFRGATGSAWNRYTRAGWGVAKSEASSVQACALADDGTALVAWQGMEGDDPTVVGASLSPQNAWSALATLQTKAVPWIGSRYGSGLLMVSERRPDGGTYSNVFDPKTGVGASKQITAGEINYVNMRTLDTTALLTWNATGVTEASLYDGQVWTTTELGAGEEGAGPSVGRNGHVVAWCHDKNTYAALYDLKNGWADPTKLGAATPPFSGPAAAIDDVGNVIAVWPNGSDLVWRRSAHGTGEWAEAQQIPDQDPGFVHALADGAGDVMVVWSNPLGIWASRFE